MLLLYAVGSCLNTAVYQPVAFADWPTGALVNLETPAQPGTPASLQRQIHTEIARQLAALPSFQGRTLSEKAFRARLGNQPKLLADLRLFRESLAVEGLASGDLAHRLGQAGQAAIFSSVQVDVTPCTKCVEGDLVWLVGHWLDAEQGRILLRIHLQKSYNVDDPGDAERAVKDLVEDYLEEVADALES